MIKERLIALLSVDTEKMNRKRWISDARKLRNDAGNLGTKYSIFVTMVTKIIENGDTSFHGHKLEELIANILLITKVLNPVTMKLSIEPEMTVGQITELIKALKYFRNCCTRYLRGYRVISDDTTYIKNMFTEEYKYLRAAI